MPQLDPLHRVAAAAIDRLLAVQAVADTDNPVVESNVAVMAADAALSGACDELAAGSSLDDLRRTAALSLDEVALLAILLVAERDSHLQRLIVSVTGDRNRNCVEVWMLPYLVPGSGATLVGPSSNLRRSALVEIVSATTFGQGVLRVPARLSWALAGDPAADEALEPEVQLLTAGDADAPEGLEAVLVVGPDRTRRRQRVMWALGKATCVVSPEPSSPEAWAALVREATLADAGVLLELDGPLGREGRRWIARATHLRWGLSSQSRLALEDLPQRDWREFSAGTSDPGPDEWEHALGIETPRLHHLTAEQLDRLRLAAAVTGGDFGAAYRRLTSAKLDALARHIEPHAGWDDLVLAPSRKGRLMDLVNRYRNAAQVYDDWGFSASPSRGLIALFSGPSGTGKTLGAEVIAGQLGLDMYRLDLSSVVSKYIGETEKNLDDLFDAAGMANIVLFFDEADALFGKRSEISDAHDRYANVETSYLLQRLERYDGIVVLATNYEKNIDQAFMRRVHTRVDFPMPSESERMAIWKRNLRESAPYANDIDLPWLVKQFDLSGAGIRNVVIDAAFLAAGDGTSIAMSHLVRGVARELNKLGRMATADRFGIWIDAAGITTDFENLGPDNPDVAVVKSLSGKPKADDVPRPSRKK
jgi:SpoVK/Ycf46/Vps4 family AAA+-type ATPase